MKIYVTDTFDTFEKKEVTLADFQVMLEQVTLELVSVTGDSMEYVTRPY